MTRLIFALAAVAMLASAIPAKAGYRSCTTNCYGNSCTTTCY